MSQFAKPSQIVNLLFLPGFSDSIRLAPNKIRISNCGTEIAVCSKQEGSAVHYILNAVDGF